jgi:hypothetical protein
MPILVVMGGMVGCGGDEVEPRGSCVEGQLEVAQTRSARGAREFMAVKGQQLCPLGCLRGRHPFTPIQPSCGERGALGENKAQTIERPLCPVFGEPVIGYR